MLALGELRAAEAVPSIAQRAERPDTHARVRVAAARALGDIATSEGARSLTTLLIASAETRPRVALEASRSLGRLRDADVRVPTAARAFLVETLDALPERRAWLTVAWLGPLHDPEAASPLLCVLERLVGESAPAPRNIWRDAHMHTVLRALAETGERRACDPVAQLLTRELSADLLRDVDATLIRLGDPRGLEHLMDAIRNGSPHARSYARTLCELAHPWTTPALLQILGSSDAASRASAAIALHKLGHAAGTDELRAFLDHPDRRNRSDLRVSLPGLAVSARLALGDPLEARLADRDRC
jgi:HEAT repeat protein